MSKVRSFRSPLVTAGVLVAVVAVGAVACGPEKDSAASSGKSGGKNAAASASAGAKKKQKSAKPTKPAAPTVKPAFKGGGTFKVGSDIQPGTYRTSGNNDGMCYWERAKDAKGDLDSVLANDNVSGSSYVTIQKTDKIFKTTDCKDWYAVTGAKSGTAPKTAMSGDGMYKIGVDIQPGTYKSTGNADGACYWERNKDALHGMDSIKANDNVTGTAIVTVAASDAYFKTNGCGDWKKTS